MSHRLVTRGAAVLAVVFGLLPLGATPTAAAAAHTADAVAGLTEETFTVGPFELAPEGQPGDQVERFFEDMPRPAADIALRSITWDLVDAGGSSVSHEDVHLHHLVLMDTSRRDALCSYPSAARFASTGMELNDVELPAPYAYHSPADGDWQGIYHVMNTSDAPVEVSIQYTIGWTEPTEEDLDVDLNFFDVTGCWGTSTFTVPGGGGAGSTFEQAKDHTMARDGEMVVGGGHLHRHGIDVALTGPGGEVCRSVATYGGGTDPHHGDMEISPCGRMDEQFDAGDTYRLAARYDNEHQVLGAMGIMGVYVHYTSPPPPPPPPPAIEVTIGSFAGTTLTGTVTCNRPLSAWVDVQLQQRKGATPPVFGYGYGNVADCGPSPTPFRIDVRGSGVLTAGTATYHLGAQAYDGDSDQSASDEAQGELRVRRRVDLATPGPDAGPLPITIDRQVTLGDRGAVISGTITCDEPQQVYLGLSGHQRVGRHHVQFGGGYEEIDCDGPTPFSNQIRVYGGRLAGGPATVTVWASGSATWEESQASATVHLPGGRPPAIEQDASSPLQIDALRRTSTGLEATLTVERCPAGAMLYVDVAARRAVGGKRIGGDGAWGSADAICDGGAETIVVPLTGSVAGKTAAVDAFAYIGGGDGYYEQLSTAAQVRIAGG